MSQGYLSSRVESLLALDSDAPKFLEALDAVASFQQIARPACPAEEDVKSRSCTTGGTVGSSSNRALPASHRAGSHEARSSLRSNLEQHGIVLAEEFLASFDPLCTQLQALERTVDELRCNCDNVERDLEAVRDRTSEYTGTLRDLRSQQERLQRRSAHVQGFLDKARLTDIEACTLSQTDFYDPEQANSFFNCLERLREIRRSETTLSVGWARTAGLELVTRTSALQSMAYERLFKWLRQACSDPGRMRAEHRMGSYYSDNGDGEDDGIDYSGGGSAGSILQSGTVKRGILMLRDRPAYYEECCVALVTAMRETMRKRFMHALTVGGPGGSPPPIERQSHTPQRYVGDMLAWVHSTIASEIDVLSNLFGGGDGDDSEEAARSLDSVDVKNKEEDVDARAPSQNTHFLRILHLIPQAFDDMVRPLKVRINQASRSLNGVVGCLEMCDLICLYHEMIGALLPLNSSFMIGLDAIITRCRSRFDELLKGEKNKLLHSTTIYPSDLSVSLPVRAAVKVIANLCDVWVRSVSYNTNTKQKRVDDDDQDDVGHDDDNVTLDIVTVKSTSVATNELEVPAAIKNIVEAVQFACQASGSSLETAERAVYIINNNEHLAFTLDSYPLTREWVVTLRLEIDTWVDVVVGDLAKKVLKNCGLLNALALAKSSDGQDPPEATSMALTEGMDAGTLGPRLSSFAARMFDMEGFRELAFLSSPVTKERCHKAVLNVLAAAYAALHRAIHRKESGYGADVAAELLPYTPQEIYTVCDIEEEELGGGKD